jgi:excisionase family DNA binding protein
MENTKATEDLFTHFRRVACGDIRAAAALTLAHRMGQTGGDRKPAATPRYLNAEQAAEYLGCSVKSLYRQVELGKLVPLRGPKRSYRFTAAMLDRYLAA